MATTQKDSTAASTPDPTPVPQDEPKETKAEAKLRTDAEIAQAKEDARIQRSIDRRASGYSAAPETSHVIAADRLYSFARTIRAMVKADNSKERQAIADAVLDDVDAVLESDKTMATPSPSPAATPKPEAKSKA